MMSLALPLTRPARRATAAAAAAAVFTLALLGSWYGGTPAGAHEGEGTITVDAAHPSASSVHYFVKVIFEEDQHPAPEATVTARATSPDGEDGEIVELALDDEDEGLYQGTVPMDGPGEWTVVFSSLNPEAELEHIETVAETEEPAEPEEPADETDESDETEVEEPTEEPEPEVGQTNPDANLTVSEGGDSDDDDPPLGLVLVAFAVLAVVVAGVFWLVIKRKTSGDAAAEGAGAAADDPAGEPADDDESDG